MRTSGGKRKGETVQFQTGWSETGTCDQAPLKSQGKYQRQVPRARGERENKRQGLRDLGEWQPKGVLLLSAYLAPPPRTTFSPWLSLYECHGGRRARDGSPDHTPWSCLLALPFCSSFWKSQLPAFALGRTCLQGSGTRNKATGPCC